MTTTTAIVITAMLLLLYYCGAIAYDLYMAKLAQANKDENKEEAVDISGQVSEFSSIPVDHQDEKQAKARKFEDLICTGISTAEASRMMKSAAEGTSGKELENIYHTIKSNQATS